MICEKTSLDREKQQLVEYNLIENYQNVKFLIWVIVLHHRPKTQAKHSAQNTINNYDFGYQLSYEWKIHLQKCY